MIGLVDLQLQQWPKLQLCPPNIEIMKLATYYKQEENKFCRIVGLEEEDLSIYSKVYVFSESESYITVPDAFKRASNVIYGGTAFTNGIYVPFENSLIDYTIPKTHIYYQFLKDKYAAGVTENELNHFMDNSYYRRFAGEATLPLPPMQRRKRVYIYDKDFFQEGWRPIIDKIMERRPSSINFIHPAHYRKISDFLDVRENSLIARGNDAYLDLNIPLKETPILMKHYKNRLLAVIAPSAQVYLSIGGSFHYRTEYFKDLIYKLNLLYVFWSQGIPLKMKYEEPKLGCYNPISDISKMIAMWTRSDLSTEKNIIERIPKDKSLSDRRPEREQLEIILEKYPSADTLFRQTTESTKKGGLWRWK